MAIIHWAPISSNKHYGWPSEATCNISKDFVFIFARAYKRAQFAPKFLEKSLQRIPFNILRRPFSYHFIIIIFYRLHANYTLVVSSCFIRTAFRTTKILNTVQNKLYCLRRMRHIRLASCKFNVFYFKDNQVIVQDETKLCLTTWRNKNKDW